MRTKLCLFSAFCLCLLALTDSALAQQAATTTPPAQQASPAAKSDPAAPKKPAVNPADLTPEEKKAIEAAEKLKKNSPAAFTPPYKLRGGVIDIFVFAYPGKACPPGSTVYSGPETQMAESFGAIYCILQRKVHSISKARNGDDCPNGMRHFISKDLKKPDNVNWCEVDPAKGKGKP